MIECTYQVLAVYLADVEKGESTLPVLAWDDAGQAMALGDKNLILASAAVGFTGLRMNGSRPTPDPRVQPPVIIRPPNRDTRDVP